MKDVDYKDYKEDDKKGVDYGKDDKHSDMKYDGKVSCQIVDDFPADALHRMTRRTRSPGTGPSTGSLMTRRTTRRTRK